MAKFPPAFLVLYSNESANKLRIPTPVLKEHRDFLVSQIVVSLTTESGPCWAVEVEKIGGDYYFTGGWSDFVNDTNVVEGKHLLFHIVDNTTLQVSLFGDHCWSEVLKVKPLHCETAEARTWRFVKEVKQASLKKYSRMYIPIPFAEGTGIAASGRMMLESEDGKKWLIEVKKYETSGSYMYSMYGWSDFVERNQLQLGDILLFELVPDSNNVVKVRALEHKAGRMLIDQSAYGGFL